MISDNIIKKIALAFFQDKKILMVRSKNNKEVYYTLGGTLEKDEAEVDCLIREVAEEIGCEVDLGSLEYLNEFEDVAHGRMNTLVNIRLYKGILIGRPNPSSEIVDIKYFDSTVDPKYLSATAINKIFPWLKLMGLIN